MATKQSTNAGTSAGALLGVSAETIVDAFDVYAYIDGHVIPELKLIEALCRSASDPINSLRTDAAATIAGELREVLAQTVENFKASELPQLERRVLAS